MIFLKKLRGSVTVVKNNSRFIGVLFVFILATLYHVFATPLGEPKKNDEEVSSCKPKSEEITEKKEDLNSRVPEKSYGHVIQSQSGDVFRVGVIVETKKAENIEVLVGSSLNGLLGVGEFSVNPSENGEYKEVIFSTTDRYEDVVFRLKASEANNGDGGWDTGGSAVYLDKFFVTRIEEKNVAHGDSLAPTLMGISRPQEILVPLASNMSEGMTAPLWIFQASSDSLQAVEFFGEALEKRRKDYVFSLSRFDSEKKKLYGGVLQKTAFSTDELSEMRSDKGNYSVALPFPLERGQWYAISLREGLSDAGPTSWRMERVNAGIGRGAEDNGILIRIVTHTSAANGTAILDGAKLEDVGTNLAYSFSLQGREIDYSNLFDASEKIRFDKKKRLVVGSQTKGEFMTYKFDTVYPFDRFALKASQEGDDYGEIKLEYSTDGVLWKEASSSRSDGYPQQFSSLLRGDGRSHTVFVRASYNAEDKKSGFFGLSGLSVDASIPKAGSQSVK